MSLLTLLYYPDVRLRTVAKPVTKINGKLRAIVGDMFDTMYDQEGIGLAATQVNIHHQIIVIDVSETRNHGMVFINPKLLEKRGETGIDEGCLSIPNKRSFVQRAKIVKICALDGNGKQFEIEASNLLAICIQHEMDHLVGKLFIDYLSPMNRQHLLQNIT